MEERLGAIRKEIEVKGHYELAYEELVFGARTAWRNAPRCVNRIVWRQLEVCPGGLISGQRYGPWQLNPLCCVWCVLRRGDL